MVKARIALTLLVAAVASVGSAEQRKSPLEGCWEMRSNKGTANGREYSLPGNVSGGQLKCYSKGHFLFVGQYTFEGAPTPSYGGGTYTLKADDYTETLIYHATAASIGQTYHFKLTVKGDTMTQVGPLAEADQKSLGNSFTEVYVRKD